MKQRSSRLIQYTLLVALICFCSTRTQALRTLSFPPRIYRYKSRRCRSTSCTTSTFEGAESSRGSSSRRPACLSRTIALTSRIGLHRSPVRICVSINNHFHRLVIIAADRQFLIVSELQTLCAQSSLSSRCRCSKRTASSSLSRTPSCCTSLTPSV